MQTFTKKIVTLAAGALLLTAASRTAAAQDLTHKAPPHRGTLVLQNASIHTVSNGVIDEGFILIRNGVIEDLGPMADLHNKPRTREAWTTVDLAGLRVYPGFVGANTIMGLTEISSVRATNDYNETGGVTPEVRAAVAINPDSWHIPVARSGGVLTVGVLPSGGSVPGRASVLRMDGWTWEDLAINDDAGLVINWPRMRPITAWWMNRSEEDQRKESRQAVQRIDELVNSAEAYFAARDNDENIPESIRLEALRPVFEGKSPVFLTAQELEDIKAAVNWAARRGFRAVIVGGRDAPLCADLLKQHDVGVIVTGTQRMPRRSDAPYDEAFTLPAQLEEAGVRWCLASSGGSSNERNLPHHAAMAVAYGLDHDAALRSITLAPAEMLGVADRLGSIENGKAATLIVTSGDPLEITTRVERAFIDGREIDLSNKQTKLAEKYREKYRQLGILDEDGQPRQPR